MIAWLNGVCKCSEFKFAMEEDLALLSPLSFLSLARSPPLLAELADLVHHHALVLGVQRGCRHAQVGPPRPHGCDLQHAVGEGEHHAQVHQSIRVLPL